MTVNTTNSLNITWDNTCLSTSAVDIYLYAPSASESLIHMWQNVNFANGYYESTLESSWWNGSSSIALQLSIIEHGSQPFMATLPAGPIWTATSAGNSSSSSTDAGITDVNNFATSGHAISHGKIAAAVIMPLLVVGALATYLYMKFIRSKTQEKTKRFSIVVDRRMSTISNDWKSMTPHGADAAARQSYRNSVFSFSNSGGRPSSTFATEGGQAGVGARGLYTHSNEGIDDQPQMSQLRPGLRTSAFENRVSRVSFADGTRPSIDSRKGVRSRAFHDGFVPPVPQRDHSFSPEQANGPLPLSTDDISAHMANHDHTSAEDMAPALSMMRSGSYDDDFLFSASREEFPLPPTPAASRSTEAAPPMMSPDDMMRAYASRKADIMSPPGSAHGSEISFPAPVQPAAGMRTLYSPTTPDSSVPMMQGHAYANPSHVYRNPSVDYGDAYGGTA